MGDFEIMNDQARAQRYRAECVPWCGCCRKRAEDDREAAIDGLRDMLIEQAVSIVGAVREMSIDPWLATDDTSAIERRACIAIALALLL